jgi:hypothetical protein
MGDDPRERQIGENESTFREVNERIEEIAAGVSFAPEFVCECGRTDCAERLRVPLDEYEAVRKHPRRFIVASGHERPAVEKVIDERQGWLVVEKTGEAGEIASEEDPRDP